MSPLTQNPSVFAVIRDALRGEAHYDFTQERIGRAITLLAIPMVLEMTMESLFAVVDMFWVAHLGADAVATVGLTEAVLSILFALAMGLSVATSAVVARRVGRKEPRRSGRSRHAIDSAGGDRGRAGRTGRQLVGARYSAADGRQRFDCARGAGYTRVIYAGSAAVMLLFSINAVFRGAGDAALAMRVLWIANLINMALNPLLIFGIGPFPRMGVLGSGVGTTVGRSIGVLIGLWLLTSGRSRVLVDLHHFRIRADVMARLVRMSIGGIFQYFVGSASWIGMVRMAAGLGSAAVAGYTVAIRIIIFAILPSWGMANAAATLVGQNLGAHKPQRAEQAVWRAGLYNMIFLGLVAADVHHGSPADDRTVHHRSRRSARGGARPALRQLRIYFLRVGDGHRAGVQRRGRHLHADGAEHRVYWVLRFPLAWLLAFHLHGGHRRPVSVDPHRRFRSGDHGGRPVPAGEMEGAGGLIT